MDYDDYRSCLKNLIIFNQACYNVSFICCGKDWKLYLCETTLIENKGFHAAEAPRKPICLR